MRLPEMPRSEAPASVCLLSIQDPGRTAGRHGLPDLRVDEEAGLAALSEKQPEARGIRVVLVEVEDG